MRLAAATVAVVLAAWTLLVPGSPPILEADLRRALLSGTGVVELPAGIDASELLIHIRERGVLFAPGRYFYLQNPQPNTLRLSFSNVDERRIARGVETLAGLLKQEIRKRQRGGRRMEEDRVALV